MSVCDEGWLDEWCPCADDCWRVEGAAGKKWGCGLGVFKHHDYNNLSDICPYADALKAVMNTPELVLVATKKSSDSCRWHAIVDSQFCDKHDGWAVEFDCPCNEWEARR